MKFEVIHKQDLEYLICTGLTVPHCFTTRHGGVSEGCLKSLNIGIHRGDRWENVLENYRILGQAVGFSPDELVLTHQVHADIVRRVGKADRGMGLFTDMPECDALITNEPGVTLAVFTADCTPILLYDPQSGAVGAVHAGWRGTASGIAAKTVQAMEREFGCAPSRLRAAIGPNIGICCFETDDDVPAAMTAALGREAEPLIRRSGEKYHVDLKGMNALWLRKSGVTQIGISADCTACQPDRFWSHRITGSDRGSQGALIRCGEAYR